MNNLETIYKYFAKRLELEVFLTLAEIKKTNDFKKLKKEDQKKLEVMLAKKIDLLKKRKAFMHDKIKNHEKDNLFNSIHLKNNSHNKIKPPKPNFGKPHHNFGEPHHIKLPKPFK